MNNEQLRIKHLAENLLATLNEVVPSNTIHYVVANNERWLKHLAEQAHTIPTVEPKTWTFMGHWVGDRIVIDYSVPGEVQDDRQDESGQYPEGLWASSASGATEEEAAAAAIDEYEDDDQDLASEEGR